MLPNRKPTAEPNPSFLLGHLLHRITTLIIVAVSLSQSICHVFAEDLINKPCRPNIVLILADDMGYGDLGVHGNRQIRTPQLDRLAAESVELTSFHVSPVCTPTRASLMTGRYNFRTRAIDTFLGRAMMDPAEVTLAEMLSSAGYRTGIFGKWHLGDHYPMRPMDQGFQESLVLWGGGLCQPSDPPEGNSYFNPTLSHNGVNVKTDGYCSDVYTTAAIDFIQANRERPFFVYLPFNCPHSPLQVPDSYFEPYKAAGLKNDQAPKAPRARANFTLDDQARLYGMITNIDDNIGRLVAKLAELKLSDNTLVIFLTDNGPQQARYNDGLRGLKGTVYEGGLRVPCFVRWPGKLSQGKKLSALSAHIDLAPTILAACGVGKPAEVALDGENLWPLLTGEVGEMPDRALYWQWHRGDVPQVDRACAARRGRYKMVQSNGVPEGWKGEKKFELFDVVADPLEKQDLASEKPEVLAALLRDYRQWFKDVSSTRGYDPPRIVLGTKHENPVLLTRQDMRVPTGRGDGTSPGFWEVETRERGEYNVTLLFDAPGKSATARLRIGKLDLERPVAATDTKLTFSGVAIEAGAARLEPEIVTGEAVQGVQYADVTRIDRK
jgi:arylsulfatase A-like enzyme